MEGIVAKPDVPYPFGRRAWVKIRHADTTDALVVGHTGPCSRPRTLHLLLPGESTARPSARLDPSLAARVGAALAAAPGPGEQDGGLLSDAGLVVEVLAGSGRHGTLTVVRIR
ncbi:hypothetical protein ACIRFF_26155 [Streptomyces cyaneofuscatus]